MSLKNALSRRKFLALAGLMAAGWIVPTASDAQAASTKPINFEVASIKLNKSANDMLMQGFTADGFSVNNCPLGFTFMLAYEFNDLTRVSGMPDWFMSEKYDIAAKVADSDVAAWQKLTHDQQSFAMSTLLEDRFKLKVRRETREGQTFALVIMKNGPKFKEAKPREAVLAPNHAHLLGRGENMASLVSILTQIVGRPVVDKTGLTGTYDFDLKYAPQQNSSPIPGAEPSEASSDLPSIYIALQEQLGLKLEPAKGPVEFLIIDHAERPLEN
jgi:uncharacterized protein (TIGR03435 family)